jgi:hypothetical protein
MVGAKPSLSQASTKYWVDVILTTSGHWKRFGCERDALAHAQVYARFPYACSVVGLRPDTRRAEDHLRVERSRMKHERSTAIPPQRHDTSLQQTRTPERSAGAGERRLHPHCVGHQGAICDPDDRSQDGRRHRAVGEESAKEITGGKRSQHRRD